MTRIGLALSAIGFLCLSATPARAFDLTGTWSGTRTCQDLFGGSKEKFKDAATLFISQHDEAIGITVQITGGGTDAYTALANFPAAKPDKGEFAMIHCGTNDIVGDNAAFDAIGRMQAATKAGKVPAKIKGTSLFSDTGTTPPGLGTCKWSLKRTDGGDPVVSTLCGSIMASRRAVKKDIEYLNTSDVQTLHDQLVRYRLASWQYTTPGASSARHLGFIIDDVEPSPSIAEGGNTVDLYGYASMAVAAIQAQELEIAALRKSVAALERERGAESTRRSRTVRR